MPAVAQNSVASQVAATVKAKATAKVNYSPEQEARMMEFAKANGGKLNQDGAAILAAEMGRTLKSVVAKLSRLGAYQAKAYVRKDGTAVVSKDEFADGIGRILRLDTGSVESLTKANRKALETIFNALATSRPIDGMEKVSEPDQGAENASQEASATDADGLESDDLAENEIPE